MNPILPSQYYIPDVEARKDEDGNIYLYGSKDCCGNDEYCSYEYQVFSSSDMKNFRAHPVSFISYDEASHMAAHGKMPLYAPDCLKIKDRYCLFYCLSDGSEGVAFSDSPAGPFTDAVPIAGADGTQIDPAVFKDDDGQVYYFWGQGSLRGGKLSEDLSEVVPETMVKGILTEDRDGFHEGISIRKRNGIYYLVYADSSRGKPTCLGYAMSDKPLGPYTKKGIIIDNTGCDPASWNNHGSIEEYQGKWYVFYHRSSHNSEFSRRVCVEEIFFEEDGTIKEVLMTSQGTEPPIPCKRKLPASALCRLSGKCYFDAYSSRDMHYEYLTNIHNGDWGVIRYMDFNCEIRGISLSCSSSTYGGTAEIYIDSMESECLAKVEIKRTSGKFDFQQFDSPVRVPSGVHAVYIKFTGIAGKLMDMGIDFTEIVDKTFYTKTYEQNRILGQALVQSKLELGGAVITSVVTKEQMEEFEVLPKHLDGIVSQLRVTKDVEAAVFLYETEDGYKVSMRSNGGMDVARVAMEYGGGGHIRAAGVSMEGNADEIIEKILEEMKKQLPSDVSET